jgi:ABC-2 type transport system permease protein
MMSVASQDETMASNGFVGVLPETWRHSSTSGRHRLQRHWENSPRRLVSHTGVLTARVLRRWSRDTATVFESLIMPAVLLVTLDIVFRDVVSQVTGHSALYNSVPLVAMVGAMTGAMIGGIGLMRERTAGLLSRFWVVPVHRASGLLSRLAAVLCVGLVLGFRFRQGILASVAWLFIPIPLGLAFSMAVIALALYAAHTIMVEATETIWALLMFFSVGFVPLEQFPHWIQPVVKHQPVTCAIEVMRGLSLGGPVRAPMVEMLLWAVGIVAICAIPMAIGYRRASMRE